jgi:predicted nucleotidyltransferase
MEAMNAEVQRIIHEVIQRLVDGYHPRQIILFGSVAYGEPGRDSDIDLLIVKETSETPLARRVYVRRLISNPQRHIPVSPLVLTPEELTQRLALGDPFYHEILSRGKVLYEQG